MNSSEYIVVFIRHGHTEWNLTNRFTGWTDIDLSEVGYAEAAEAGRRLVAAGVTIDEAHTSVLRRTRQTVESMIAAAGWQGVTIQEHWRLNERHYGALQGMNKQEIFSAWGEESSRRWWRGYHESPPALAHDDPRHPRFDMRYAHIEAEQLPATESLRDCQQRALPYWQDVLLPRLSAGRRVLVASHGNTLRGLVMHLDGISAEAMEKVEIPSGVPLVYRFSSELAVLGSDWLG